MCRFDQRSLLKGTLSITKGLSHQELLQNFILRNWKFCLDIVKKTREVCVPGVNSCSVQRHIFHINYLNLQATIIRKRIYLFSRLYDASTSSCAHLTIILSSSSICLCHSSLLPLIPFPPSVL